MRGEPLGCTACGRYNPYIPFSAKSYLSVEDVGLSVVPKRLGSRI